MKYLYSFIVVAILFTHFSCKKNTTNPNINNKPETVILSYAINPIAELDSLGNQTSYHKTTVYWKGSDVDGQVMSFMFSTDSLNFDTTSLSQHDFILEFTSSSSTHKIWVKSIDDLGAEDTTPAVSIIQLNFNIEIETSILDGPLYGAEVSSAVRFKINATTNFGYIKYISYKIDNGSWTNIISDTSGTATIDILNIQAGVRTLYFAGKQYEDQQDETPATTSLIVRDVFKPIIINKSPVFNGGGWYAGYPLTFKWATIIDHYYGVLPLLPFSFALNDSSNFNEFSNLPLASGWVADSNVTDIPSLGFHTFYLKVRDAANNLSLMKIEFEAASIPVDGILVVNGVDPQVYGSILQNKIDSSAYWGTLQIDFWDIFGTMNSTSLNLPTNVCYVGGGTGLSLSPIVIAHYSTIVWLGNNYNGDLEVWNQSPILHYLIAGGNVIFVSRYAADFLHQELTDYLNIGWRDGNASGSATGSTIEEYVPIFPGLISMQPFLRTMTATSIFSSYPFNSGGSVSDDDVTNWNGSRSFSQNKYSTLLFAHRSSGYDTSYAFDYVRGLGVWTHPNFAFSSLTTGNEFPTPGTIEAKGNFILINGRHYGFNTQDCRHNFEFILRNMCGEQ